MVPHQSGASRCWASEALSGEAGDGAGGRQAAVTMATRFAVLHSDARMPAINYDEDTEFNEALRARGIIPQRAPTSRSPSPVLARSPSPSLSDLDDLLLTTDDVLPRAVLEQYRATRMREEGVGERNRRYGRVYPIGKGDYTREVTEGSKADLEGESEGEGTGVVCYLFKDSCVPPLRL